MARDPGPGRGVSGGRPALVIVAAVARNGIIGARDRLPWRLPTDLKRFRSLTMGKPLVMGRKTFESIGRGLPGRETIVVTKTCGLVAPGVRVANGMNEALSIAASRADAMGVSEVIIAGGGSVYAETIGRADQLLITEINLDPEGDSFFPPIDPMLWREAGRERGTRGPGDEAEFAFVHYVKRTLAATAALVRFMAPC